MAFQGPWRRSRRRREGQSAGPRPLGCLWPLFWLILLIILLGLLFGGYRKGTKADAPGSEPPRAPGSVAVAAWNRPDSTANSTANFEELG